VLPSYLGRISKVLKASTFAFLLSELLDFDPRDARKSAALPELLLNPLEI
jgi:hypothetical protein